MLVKSLFSRIKSGLFNLNNNKKNNSDCHETAKLSAKSGVLKMALPISDLKDCNASDSEKSWVILKLCQGTFRKVFIASCCYIRDH